MTLVALCYGTRPQVIKASVLRRTLATVAPVRAIDTGQHYDYELNALLYEQLAVAPPDEFLNVGSGSHASQLGAVLAAAAASFERQRPDVVVVIGDTNSTLGCALAAVQLRIPVVHVEAGLRAADALMAEEINRRAVDAVAQVLCAPSHSAAIRLSRERSDAMIVETGDVARDVLDAQLPGLDDLSENGGLPAVTHRRFLLATLHRAELTNDADRLRKVFKVLSTLDLPVLLPAHPRTRLAMEKASIQVPTDRVVVFPPLGYLETLACVRKAAAVVTDSGGVQREAYWLGTPCVTVRAETEWSETVAAGANRLSSPTALDTLPATVSSAIDSRRDWDRDAYGDGRAARKVAASVARLLAGGAPGPHREGELNVCGIAGLIGAKGTRPITRTLHALTEALVHRGPDAGGIVSFAADGALLAPADQERAVAALGHRRLSIVDIASGHQPLANEIGSVWVVFNGEIYNFRALRRELEQRGHQFRTNSDTEILVHAWEEWDEGLLPRLNGIFAFALYDVRSSRVLLARDPVGAKPLYVGVANGLTWWASEIDAARRAGLVGGEIDSDAIKLFLMLRFIPSPWSPYRGAWKVPPSHYAVLDLGRAGNPPQFIRYDSAIRSAATPVTTGEWRDALADELSRAVSRQLMSDVPVGSLLSGGVDSSVVTAIMARETPTPPQAFAIGFRDATIANETDTARLAATEIGVPLETVSVDSSAYFNGWPGAARHLGEPIANSGVLLVGLLCGEVRKTHKVVLTGQGADEPLGGYPRHVIQRLAAMGKLAPSTSAAIAQRVFGGDAGDRLRRALDARSFEERASAILAVVPPDRVDVLFRERTTPTRQLFAKLLHLWRADVDDEDPTGSLLRLDMRTSLADDLLIVADHFSMQQSVELRVPFLDLQLLDLVLRMPSHFKISRIGRRKWLYRQAAYRLLPRATAARLRGVRANFGRKIGFATPLDAWFSGGPRLSESPWLAEHVDVSSPALAMALPSPRQRAAFHALDLWLDGR